MICTHGTHGKLLTLALTTLMSMAGCDQEGSDGGDHFRVGVTTGAGLTLNTNQWVSSAARDVYEFGRNGDWHTNSFGYETQLATIYLPGSPYGPVTSQPGVPAPGEPKAVILPGDELQIKLKGPTPGSTEYVLEGDQLIGMKLTFTVHGTDGVDHSTAIQVVDSMEVTDVGLFYEFHKVDTASGTLLAPLCEQDSNDLRMARVYDGLTVDALTGAMTFTGEAVHHIACTSSAPGKAALYGYGPAELDPLDPQAFALANRVIRADYCADGHPYTYPGNLFAIYDNISSGNEGATLADVEADLDVGVVIEAVWDEHGVVCIGSPRASNVGREDVVCPTKRFADGSVSYNWRPPTCETWVDQNPNAMRFFSTTEE